jgi:hypothetical protein
MILNASTEFLFNRVLFFFKYIFKFAIIPDVSLMRGVKQRGIPSPALFNLLMDILIKRCYDSGIGAKIFDIVINIIGFADDHTLLGTNFDETQRILNICWDFSLKIDLEYNLETSFFIVFGTRR